MAKREPRSKKRPPIEQPSQHEGGAQPTAAAQPATRPPQSTTDEGYAPRAYHDDIVGYIEQVKQEWEATADALPQIVCLLDQHGHIVRANRAVERWGLGEVAQARGRDLHKLLHPRCKMADCYLKSLWGNANTGLRNGEPTTLQTEDPVLLRHLEFQIHSQPPSMVADGRGPSCYAVAVVADISEFKAGERALQALTDNLELQIETRTVQLEHSYERLQQEIVERQRIELALNASREEYRQLVETMNEGLAAMNNTGLITYINERIVQMLGYSREEVIGHPARKFIDPSSLDIWDRNIALRETGKVGNYQLALQARNGKRVWVLISPSLLRDRTGQRIGSFAVITDLSDRVRMEQALKASEHELRVLSTQVLTAQEGERQRIASDLHDGLGQTLSAIKFSLENSLIQLRKERAGGDLAHLEALIPRMQLAVEEVRRISMDLRPSMLDDLGLLATLSWFCREFQQDYSGITVKLRTDVEETDIIRPLKLIMFRIVQEALNNAAKHARTETVEIRLFRRAAKIELDISDQGVGFDPEEVAAKRSRRKGGAGLLSMRERAEYSGGRFKVTSGKGTGTRIHIVWPAASHER